MIGGGLLPLLKKLAGREIANQPIASHVDPQELEMQDDPGSQFVLGLRRKRKALMLKKLLQQEGQPDLMRDITVRERST